MLDSAIPAIQLKRLMDQRDLAAYRVVSAVQTVCDFWEAQNFEEALALLERARNEFEAADLRITQFLHSLQGEHSHGNRTAA